MGAGFLDNRRRAGIALCQTQTGYKPMGANKMSLVCDCKKWKELIRQIDNAFTMNFIHLGRGYEGEPFSFCPWCGEPLRKFQEEDTNG